MTIFRFSASLFLGLALTSCSGAVSSEDQRICSKPGTFDPFTATKQANRSSVEQNVINEDCIHAWAYRLGRAPGGNKEIAEAVLEACSLGILYEANSLVEEQTGKKADRQSESAVSQQLRSNYVKTALFRVVQGRAGKCDIP